MDSPAPALTGSRPRPAPTSACCITTSAKRTICISRCSKAPIEQIRVEERGLDLEHLDPPKAIERLISFTWNYFLRNPEFLALLNTENLAKARHLKRSTKVKSMHSPFVEMIRTVVIRGVESGDFLVSVDPVQLYISIAALSFFYLSNSATLSVIFGRDLLKKEARDERLEHMVALVLAALTGKSSAAFGRSKTLASRAAAPSDA